MNFKNKHVVSIISASVFLSGMSHAQLEEVIVTAEKRSTNIQQTPMAISAMSGEMLQERQITDMESLMQSLPNVDFGLGLGQARISIRGIGFDFISGGNESRIAYHQDGVYYSRSSGINGSFFDVDRVEVLRGPQGTLYGRNATGGVVNVITRDPGEEFNGYVSGTIGNYGQFVGEGAVGGILSDTVSGRLAFQYEDRGGYGENELTGNDDVEDKNIYALRGKLRFEPSDDFDLTLTADYIKQDDHANGYQFVSANPETAAPVLPVPRPLTGELFGGVAPQKARNETGEQTQNYREISGLNATANWRVAEFDIVSITSYRDVKYELFSEIDQTSADIATIHQNEDSQQFSQEFRISQSLDNIDWMLGGYFFNEEVETGNLIASNLLISPLFSPLNPAVACGGGTRPCTEADLDPRGYSQMFYPYGELETEAWAVFGNVRYAFNETWSLRLGLRYSREKKDVFNQTRNDFFNFNSLPWTPFPLSDDACGAAPSPAACSFSEQRDSETFSSWTPSVTLDYQPNEDVYVYATYAEGMKSGGYNVGNVQPGYEQEDITDYEVGAKIDWLDGRLRTNLSAFYYDYENIQSTTVSGIPPRIEILNAPGARQKGVELEVTAAPIDGFEVNMDIAWLDSEYRGPFLSWDTSLPWISTPGLDGDPSTPGEQPTTDQGGNQLVYAPELTFGLGAQYTWYGENINITLRGETRYKDDTYFSIFNRDYVAQEAFWKSNVFLTLNDEKGDWSTQIFVRNIADKTTINATNVGPGFWGSPLYGSYAPPRTFGLKVSYNF